jgi:hydrogenase nickel incorporation protein HypA/HybF
VHEFSLAVEIADLATAHAEAAGLAQVSVLTLSVGSLASVEIEALRFALASALLGTPAEGAELVIEELAARARCGQCGLEQPIVERFAACARCGAFGLRVIAGDALTLRSIAGSTARRHSCV